MSNNKRLERDLSNKVLGGVCSGLGNYFGIDPIFWRILFFILFFAGCSGLLIYIILWIVMPESKGYTNAAYSAPQNGDADPNADADQNTQPAKSDGRWIAGLILIGIGVVWLLARYIPQINWHNAWPIILIGIGIFFLIPIKNKKS